MNWADDYGRLITEGCVYRRLDDTDAWRTAMREAARMDRLRIRTGVASRDRRVAWAVLPDVDVPVDLDRARERINAHLRGEQP